MSSFHLFAQERGLIIRHLETGKWVRVPTVDHPHKKNGSYFHGIDFAFVQNWALQEKVDVWQEEKIRTALENADFARRVEEGKKKYAQERAEGQQKSALKAKWILAQCELDKHAYLDSKGFRDELGNVWRKDEQSPILVIPMFHCGEICGCQMIDTQGNKKFLYGQRTNDACFHFDGRGKKFLVEGYATGLSLKTVLMAMKIKFSIYVCFSAGNLLRFARLNPDAFVLADNDASGTGLKVAKESGLKYFMSEVEGEDFNDLHKRAGTFKAGMMLLKGLG